MIPINSNRQKENNQNQIGFTQLVRCSRHGKISTMMCIAQKCQDRTLCQECILNHTHSHLSKIIPIQEFNNQTNLVPTIIAKEIIENRSRIYQLQNQQIVLRESRKGELKTLFQSIKQIINQEIDQFFANCVNYIDNYFGKFTNDITKQLYNIQNHLQTINPYIGEQPVEIKSQNVEFLIKLQENLIKQIIPEIQQNVQNLSTAVHKQDIYIENEYFITKLSSNFKKILNSIALFNYPDQQKQQQQQQNSSKKIDNNNNDCLLEQVQKRIDNILPKPKNNNTNLQMSANVKNLCYYDLNQIPSYLKIFTGHQDIVIDICIIDKDRFASASGDMSIKIWNLDSGHCIGTLKGHIKDIWSLTIITPTNSQVFLASSSSDLTIKIWDIENLCCISTFGAHTDIVRCLTYLPDSKQLVSGSGDCTIRLWDVIEKRLIKTIGKHNQMVKSLLYLEQKQILISAGQDKLLKCWDMKSFKLISDLSGHKDEVNAICYLFDKGCNPWIASGGHDNVIIIWDIQKMLIISQLQGHQMSVNGLIYSYKQNLLISCSSDKCIKFWDLNNEECIHTQKVHSDIVQKITYHEYRNLIISASWDHNIRAQSLRQNFVEEQSQQNK